VTYVKYTMNSLFLY